MDPDTAKNKRVEWFWERKKVDFKNAEKNRQRSAFGVLAGP